MMGRSHDPGTVMGELFANAPGPRVSSSAAAQLGREVPPDATVDRSANRITFTGQAECLDWVLIRGERHLERVLREFVQHYNHQRPHRGIDLQPPVAYPTLLRFIGGARVERTDRLGGLLHEYRVAA
jgi:transposase InsO family protein